MYFYFVKTTVESSSSIRFEFKNSTTASVVYHATKYATSVRLSLSEHPAPLIAEVGNQNNVKN